MKANEFVKRFGWDNSKECLRILRLRDTDFPFVCVCGDCTERDDLERLVESHDLVEKYKNRHGGIRFRIRWGMYRYGDTQQFNDRLKQAILDVESCHVD